jgi:SprT protein
MVEEILAKARLLYGVDLSATKIIFTNMGRTNAGEAIQEDGELTLRFNSQVPKERLIAEVIPHEVAHLVCYRRPELGKNHCDGWKSICIALGGIGTRTIEGLDLKPSKTYRKFLYRTDYGNDVVLSTIRHNKLQRGKVVEYFLNKTIRIKASHFLQEID